MSTNQEQEDIDGNENVGSELLDSVAFSLIEDISRAKKITKPDADFLKEKYKGLYDIVMDLKKQDAALARKCRSLNNDILSDKINVEKIKSDEAEEANNIKKLEKQRESAIRDLEFTEQRETMSKFELVELKKLHEELSESLNSMKKDNIGVVKPILENLRKQIDNLDTELTNCDDSLDKANLQKTTLIKKLQEIEILKKSKSHDCDRILEEAATSSLEPGRLTRMGFTMEKASTHMKAELEGISKRIAICDDMIEKQVRRRIEGENLKKSLQERLQLHYQTIEKREEEIGVLKNKVENEKCRHHDLVTRKVDLNLQKKEIDTELRHKRDQLVFSQKEYDSLKRFYKKKLHLLDSDKRLIPTLEQQQQDEEIRLHDQKQSVLNSKERMSNLKDDIDNNVVKLLQQEDVEQSKKDALEQLISSADDSEAELLQLIAEEKRTTKLVSVLSSHRDIKAREETRVNFKEKETRQHVRMKELIVLDLTKRCNEISNRLKEFSALYEVVKNERNKYVNLIQSSSQALAEMREKIRILNSEVEILRNESQGKDKAMTKEKTAHAQAQSQRDALRQDMNKLLSEYRQKQAMVEQQIQEIDKLNLVINNLEKEMLGLKGKYERGVDERNTIGVQLIDRNDELCILYERSKQQQETLNNGEKALQRKEEDLRMLRLQLEELQRQYRAAVAHTPETEQLRIRLKALEVELSSERVVSEQLGGQMEDPQNTARWRAIEGEDAGAEALETKMNVLEEMLNKKRAQILEKGLVLEEVVALTERLRGQALYRRDNAKSMAEQLNDLQTRIRDITKKMLCSVSELSMYQATALRLQQEKIRREKSLEEAKWRAEHGEAPSEDAIKEWNRSERRRVQAAATAIQRQEELAMDKPDLMFKTTAEPRPTAYIPDEIGIPKPYGMSAPFKPQEKGGNMRHIRPPQPKPIEI
eukprot:gene698-1337_t